jgi:hypothetical protein
MWKHTPAAAPPTLLLLLSLQAEAAQPRYLYQLLRQLADPPQVPGCAHARRAVSASISGQEQASHRKISVSINSPSIICAPTQLRSLGRRAQVACCLLTFQQVVAAGTAQQQAHTPAWMLRRLGGVVARAAHGLARPPVHLHALLLHRRRRRRRRLPGSPVQHFHPQYFVTSTGVA